ncbi:hypothetical protein D1007_34052 [Hordeum vulgare]|nr:hypothetical protein D1007_34052 [Hordeum vulgare]
MLPRAERVAVHLPGAKGAPTPRDSEVVVFKEHFFHGFGLPASDLFSPFLIFFGLQPHHFAPNAFLKLAAYHTLCEGRRLHPQLYECLQFYRQLTADVEVWDPVEIEVSDEVELQSSASEDVEGVAESEDTEPADGF